MNRDLRPQSPGHRSCPRKAVLYHRSPRFLQKPPPGWGCRCPQLGLRASLPPADFFDCCHLKGHVRSKPSTPGIRGAAFPGRPRLPAQRAGRYRGRAELLLRPREAPPRQRRAWGEDAAETKRRGAALTCPARRSRASAAGHRPAPAAAPTEPCREAR